MRIHQPRGQGLGYCDREGTGDVDKAGQNSPLVIIIYDKEKLSLARSWR